MENPWAILGLDPAAATEKDVKVAYARLIRQYRPDADPEGFQRVRQAYDSVLAQMKDPNREAMIELSSPVPHEEDTSPPVSLPPSVMEAQMMLKVALDTKDPLKIGDASNELQKRCLDARPGFLGIELWNQALYQLFDGDVEKLVEVVRFGQLIEELRHGQAKVCHAVIGCWVDQKNWVQLQTLADCVEKEQASLANATAASVAVRLGLLFSFKQPHQAQRLAHLAYPNLSLDSRDGQVHQVEQQAALGACFLGFPAQQAEFWQQRFDDPNGEGFDWESPAALAARRFLVVTRQPDWPGFGFVQRVASEAWWNEFENAMNRRAGQLGPLPPAKKWWEASPWAVVSVVFLLFRLLSAFMEDDHSRSSLPPRPTPVPSQAVLPQRPPPVVLNPSTADYSLFSNSQTDVQDAALASCRAQLERLVKRRPQIKEEVSRLARANRDEVRSAFAGYQQTLVGRSAALDLACGLLWNEETDNDVRLLAVEFLADGLSAAQLRELLSVTAQGNASMKSATVECIRRFRTLRSTDALPSELTQLTDLLNKASRR